ncbi:MAG: TIGR00270 family protein [Methanobacteriota archaeon]|nr:MAG: TIGR00270 family protein [Euryarchaeota archaeon]
MRKGSGIGRNTGCRHGSARLFRLRWLGPQGDFARGHGAGSVGRRQQLNDETPSDVLIADCGVRVRQARQQRGWDHAQLAQKAAEKKSIIASVEAGHHHPAEKLVRKLERLLGIKLTEAAEGEGQASAGGRKAEALTMGDLLKQALDED